MMIKVIVYLNVSDFFWVFVFMVSLMILIIGMIVFVLVGENLLFLIVWVRWLKNVRYLFFNVVIVFLISWLFLLIIVRMLCLLFFVIV